MTMLDQETVVWYSADAPPDTLTTVLVYAPGADEPVWLGYFDGEAWCSSEGVVYRYKDAEAVDGEIAAPVTAWAAMPTGAICSEDAINARFANAKA